MTIDWTHFSPWAAIAGGLLIGLAATALLLLTGRIAGISGILNGLLHQPAAGDRAWRAAFMGGLLLAPLLYRAFAELPPSQTDASFSLLLASGLLVGFGTQLGSGCTSGHGVCGLSRLSVRSLVATLTFMAAGFITVFIRHHVLG